MQIEKSEWLTYNDRSRRQQATTATATTTTTTTTSGRRRAQHDAETLNARRLIDELTKSLRTVWKLSGFWLSYNIQSSRFRWLRRLHAIVALFYWAILLCTMTISLVKFWWQRGPDPYFLHLTTQLIIVVQFASSALFLATVQLRSGPVLRKFASRLQAATLGIGLARQRNRLKAVQTTLLCAAALQALLWIAYFAIYFYYTTSANSGTFQPAPLLLAIIHSGVLWTLANTLLIGQYAMLATEFHALNVDLRSDRNCWQVALVKHYLSVHGRLKLANVSLNSTFAPLIGISLTCQTALAVLHTNALISSNFVTNFTTYDKLFTSLCACFLGLQLLTFTLLSTFICRQASYIFYHMQKMSSINLHWEQDCFSVVTFYEQAFRDLPAGIGIEKWFFITGPNVFKALLLILTAVALSRLTMATSTKT
ncbi:hypothetical protein T4E_6423 [Trichinella pseudospiralis]|uniref:Uncharacterized protein n=1 Tax=Trichinella pseudospiralis TaxID=6337 RepID=A0A0V0YI27_TRIPS|nr:hypothetical protein T4E_6423 [Trichinella pseudospiralis]